MPLDVSAAFALPDDSEVATLVGRVWRPDVGGPSVVALRGAELVDISAAAPTMRDLCEAPEPAALARDAKGEPVGHARRHPRQHAAGQARPEEAVAARAGRPAGGQGGGRHLRRLDAGAGDRGAGARRAASRRPAIRAEMTAAIGDDLARLKPGSEPAMALKELLIEKKMWSQYLEVGIGPDAEVFTKAPPMAAVGHLAEAGIRPDSSWNNPEPEVALVAASTRRDRRRDARQRRQSPRLRGPLGAAPRQGQGQQRQRRARAVHPPLRPRLLARRRAEGRGPPHRRRAGGLPPRRRERHEQDQPRPGRPDRRHHRREPPAIPTASSSISARCSRRSRTATPRARASPTRSATSSPSPRRSSAGSRTVIVYCADAEPWTFGAAALMRNLAKRGLI